MYQLTIFDLLQEPDIDTLTIQEAVERIGERLGLSFTYNSFFEHYEAKKGKLLLTAEYNHYSTMDEKNGKRFIGVGYDCKKDQAGGGAPCDSLQEAVDWFQRIIERYEK